jgi:UDP-3-O-[3-hydroxymyristoyl] N-acetylglucosamine deacetylase
LRFETTIQRSVEVSGVGLHSGVPVKLRMSPAPAGSGIVFRRPDLENFPISASWKHVARVSYATSLMRQGVLIQTTEHLLSTLYSFGIDNVAIEVDNLEVPILDGSGKPFVEMLRTAGLRQLRRKRRYLRIRRPVTVEDGRKRISIIPHDSFRLTCDIDFPQPIGRQSIEMEVTPERYAEELSPARTFGFDRELDQLREMGLIRGASLSNAVCFTDDGVLNPEGLRFADECCRHKALDLIGDLALIGRPLLGHVIAERAGHAMHTALVAKIMSDSSL